MTWFGIAALVIVGLALAGNVVQYRSYAGIENQRLKRYLKIAWFIAVFLNVFMFFGILFVGTGSL